MMTPVSDWITTTLVLGMVVTAAVTWLVFFFGTRSPGRSAGAVAVIGVVLFAWLAAALLLGRHGFFQPSRQARFPNIALGFTPILVGLAAYAALEPLRDAVRETRPHLVIGIQVYRILGFIFLVFYAQGRLPGVFALPAGIGDVLIGVTAPLAALLVWKGHRWGKGLTILWNIAGIYDLVQAVALGFLTAPSRYQLLSFNASNLAIGAFPLVLVPTFAVPLSILLHMVSLHGILRGPGALRKVPRS
jgi:VanZ family protein